MEDRKKKAVDFFSGKYNCAQSIFGTYADLFGLDTGMAFRIACPFGGGLAGMHHVCGAVSGMCMLAGLHNGTTEPGDKVGRKANYDVVKMLTDEFKAEFGSILCSQLTGIEPGLPADKPKRPCVDRVRVCAELIEKYLLDNEKVQ